MAGALITNFQSPVTPYSTPPNVGGAFASAGSLEIPLLLLTFVPLPGTLYLAYWRLNVRNIWPVSAGRQFWDGIAARFFPSCRVLLTQGGKILSAIEEISLESQSTESRCFCYSAGGGAIAESRAGIVPPLIQAQATLASSAGPVAGPVTWTYESSLFAISGGKYGTGFRLLVPPGSSGEYECDISVVQISTTSQDLLTLTGG